MDKNKKLSEALTKSFTIVIDAGHGMGNRVSGKFDPGAVNGKHIEAQYSYEFANMLMESLQFINDSLGYAKYIILLTRSGANNINVPLVTRTELANKNNADLFLSIHLNSSLSKSAKGFECFTSVGQSKADKLATLIYKNMAESFGDKVRLRTAYSDGDPDQESNFFVLKNTKCPAVLIELCFISNDEEINFYNENKYIYVESIAKSIEEFCGKLI